jgi:TonB-like protein
MVINNAMPVYPELARRTNICGTVKVGVLIAPNGRDKSNTMIGGNPYPDSCGAARGSQMEARACFSAEHGVGGTEIRLSIAQDPPFFCVL